jgi:hypothetical protein
VSGGRDSRPIGAYELAKAVEELGAGEILLNCIDCDGMFTYSERLSFARMLWYSYKDFSLLCSACKLGGALQYIFIGPLYR